ncbi:MarR family winged helix-turn-helix transcriptional regulator (plasmid) [Streptomyces sp. NBC_01340]|uniref:MarR family winged helix-turn-helix transcriptional regulator n=1 Tax=unclassified Streptomyces TaxID=2593676 RepID=UPI002252881A|nr:MULTISPECIES: MarR family winged helix-turn-helix transcriptional regulator [unclassified Streptomyces]MCX4461017.1 MarR family winged helix-turn-helix transcriptional regulator [Streptomyces sp. NBC_01719]MCX4499654.1 MarR family winged helix-turn-helix transcriptional regulator [Streptomyces sp. NBC_01728]WSI44813.1 MarR family winged helix-turn-helix transcriptional regulator [Streptomyces sp. NBC_01340]
MNAVASKADECNNLALRKASRYLGATYDKALAPLGLRATQFSILQQLSMHEEMTISGLADVIAMDRTTMASNLKPLAREGLVTIETAAADRRARSVMITPEGLARMKAALPHWEGVQAEFEEKFGAEPAAQMRTLLENVLGTGFDPWAE